ncbi:MAG: hypothetical protein A3F17_01180 [Gammaproteobacteria bacterium RIFCSPHIGHO2_12_FULL_41_15]|nr:MAG: hypothetical protein A3F17_01180 [Gammaproteobacteria bacterium RIFCSPHIGHO2_12_FULL_41_15]
MNNLPSLVYQQKINSGELSFNLLQQQVVAEFDCLYQYFIHPISLFQKIKRFFHRTPIKGLYLWGSVGVGKTMLMDLFFNCLPTHAKMRTHLHSFLLELQHELRIHQGQANPIQKIAHQISQQTHIIFFDEFYVKDVADAMILGDLLKALFKKNVIFIASTNVAPDKLYEKGLQRERFLETIQFIKNHCTIIELTLNIDYRRQVELIPERYIYPHKKSTYTRLATIFKTMSQNEYIANKTIQIFNRTICFIQRSEHCIWFDCTELCRVPRAVQDYLELTQQFQFIMISDIPQFSYKNNDLALNFIKLIDVLYEKNTLVIFSAAVDPDHLYKEGNLQFEFQRTQSRLIEMQSTHYPNKPTNASDATEGTQTTQT